MTETVRGIDTAMEERSVLKELRASAGWKFLMEVAEAQRSVRSNKILLTPCPTDQLSIQEFEKGEVSGIMLFQTLPDTAIEALDAEIGERKARLGITDEDEETHNAP